MSVKDFPPRPDGASEDDLMGWLDDLGNRQNIDNQLELTSPAAADEFLIFDASAGKTYKITLATLKTWLGL